MAAIKCVISFDDYLQAVYATVIDNLIEYAGAVFQTEGLAGRCVANARSIALDKSLTGKPRT